MGSPIVTVIDSWDNSSPPDVGYSETGTWLAGAGGVNNNYKVQAAVNGAPTATATFEFTGLSAGTTVEVFATWIRSLNRVTDVPYTISGIVGGDQTFYMSGEVDPVHDLVAAGTVGSGKWFEEVGPSASFVTVGTTLTVSLTNTTSDTLPQPGSPPAGGVQYTPFDAVAIRYEPVVVPEPASLWCFAALCAWGSTRRRRSSVRRQSCA